MAELLYGDFVRNIARSFDEALSEIEAVHNFEFGGEFEVAICHTLRRVLPHRFGICRGYVVNPAGDVAGDDIIVYERVRFPTSRLLSEDYSRKEKVPIEAVLAYIEAKHTLQFDGDGDSSLRKALDQAANVKELCDQRYPVPLTQVAHRMNLGSGFNISPLPGWPSKQNPVYTAILSRRVRIQQSGTIIEDSGQIYDALVGRKLDSTRLPDLIVTGRPNIALPVVKLDDGQLTITSPFSLEAGSILACRVVEEIAFGVGLAHLLWALDNIVLGSMPWGKILGNSLGL